MKKNVRSSIIIALICFLFLTFIFTAGFFSTINTKVTDSLYGGITPLSNIVIIAIDDQSLQDIGRWPWNREVFAELITKTKDARVVGIDIAFFEESNSVSDLALTQAVKEAGNIILTAEYISFAVENKDIIGKDILLPIGDLKNNAQIGYVNIVTDNDGVTRATNLNIKGEYKSFTQQVYETYLGREFKKLDSRFLINFVGKPQSFTTYSLSDVLKQDISFKDSLVLVGATAPDLHDDYFVPTSKGKAMPGVEVHANTIQTMLTHNYLVEQSYVSVLVMILILCFIVIFLVQALGLFIAGFMVFGLFLLSILAGIILFSQGVVMNILYAVISIAFSYAASTAYGYKSEQKSKKELKKAFSKYVSPVLVQEIMKNPEKLKLGGEKRHITIMFSDIRGFTSISESMKPGKLVSLLNEYLTEMTNIVLRNKGVVDKFIGDAVMVFWGAPLDEKEQQYLACKTAVEMMESIKKWKKINIGLGINDGDVIVGNMGSNERFDYTVIGDDVNLASRLEGLNKQYGTNIIVSKSVYEKVKDKFVFRRLDLVKVKGKKKPVMIYELTRNMSENHIEIYEQAFEDYLNKDFDSALKSFNKLNDKASKVFVERCKVLKKKKVINWDGSFEHTSK